MIPESMATEPLQRHSITLVSEDGAATKASEWAVPLAEKAGWPEDRAYALDLCVVELVTNVVQHGYKGNAGTIRLELGLAPEGGVLTIADHAPAFDPLSVPEPVKAASLEESKIGGWGIHLVRSSATACRYERRGGENVFTAGFGMA